MKGPIKPILAVAIAAVVLFAVSALLRPVAAAKAEADLMEMMGHMLPGSTTFTPEEYTGEDESITAVYKGETGWVLEVTTAGYADDIVMVVGVNASGSVTGLMVKDMAETYGLGDNAMIDYTFLMQFLNTSGEAAVGENIDTVTGATVTSRAVTKAVNSACAFVTGADVSSSATEWGG